MRLICPNCAAQYEIDASLIPAGGRDVQCSNCGHTWFTKADTAASAQADEADATYDSGANQPEEEAPEARRRRRELDERTRAILREEAEREAAQRKRSAGIPIEEQTEMGLPDPPRLKRPASADKPAQEPPRKPAEPERKGLMDLPDRDPDDTGTQRSAAATARARVDTVTDEDPEDDAYLEDWDTPHENTPPDFDEDAPDAASPQEAAPEPQRRPGRDPDEARAAAELAAASRGDLLPDIDQINSTLTATSQRQRPSFRDIEGEPEEDDGPAQQAGSGFRLGFGVILAVTATAMVLYYLAPQIVRAIPSTEPALAAYVQAVNEFRASLDALLIRASEMIVGSSAE